MGFSALDAERLEQALELARLAVGVSDPNPRVGCILGRADGLVLGVGHTQEVGGAHAEVAALTAARASGHDLRGATAWVTLEPCAHFGRTPPCCDALIEAGVARVVIATGDPAPHVAGKGAARMRAAGIDVVYAEESFATIARELNVGFFSRMERGRPWVRMKIAASLDGVTALNNGVSQWITGEAARADGHSWRRRAGAVLTGIGTVLADDPRLDVRAVETRRQPLRVVLDSRLQTPPGAQLIRIEGHALVVTCHADTQRAAALRTAGAEVLCLPATVDDQVSLAAVLTELAARQINEVHVEAGARLNTALLTAGLVDELLIYLAPKLLGAGLGMTSLGPFEKLADGLQFGFFESVPVGSDLRLRARRQQPDSRC